MIQQLNGRGEIDPSELLPPEEIAEHLIIEDLSVFTDEHEYEPHITSTPSADKAPEDMIQRDESVIFWLPRDVCLVNLFVDYFYNNNLKQLFYSVSMKTADFSQIHKFEI